MPLRCAVCLETTPPAAWVQCSAACPSSHGVCTGCVELYVTAWLEAADRDRGRSTLRCPAALASGRSCGASVSADHVVAAFAASDDLKTAVARVRHNLALFEVAETAGTDADGHPVVVATRCPGQRCQRVQLFHRSEVEGVPLRVFCGSSASPGGCGVIHCTGCGHECAYVEPREDSDDDSELAVGDGAISHEKCRTDIHQPARVVVDYGPLDTAATFSALTASQQASVLRAINDVVRAGLGGVRCPTCRRPACKDEGCTHVTCDPSSGGCGTDFCYCCGGLLARSGAQYMRLLREPATAERLALLYSAPPALPPSGREIYLPKVLHNDAWQRYFHPDAATPAGRCPSSMAALYQRHPWFTPRHDTTAPSSSLHREIWCLERWTELKLLRALHQFFAIHGAHGRLVVEVVHHPGADTRDMPFVTRWAAALRGCVTANAQPSADLFYHEVVPAVDCPAPLPVLPALPALHRLADFKQEHLNELAEASPPGGDAATADATWKARGRLRLAHALAFARHDLQQHRQALMPARQQQPEQPGSPVI